LDAVAAEREIMSWNLPETTEKNHGNFSQLSLNLGQDMNLRLSEYEAGLLD
jgi:hypothetical protein